MSNYCPIFLSRFILAFPSFLRLGEGSTIVCPLHRSAFSLETGNILNFRSIGVLLIALTYYQATSLEIGAPSPLSSVHLSLVTSLHLRKFLLSQYDRRGPALKYSLTGLLS